MVFGQKLMETISAKKDTIGKSISRGAEWHKFPSPSLANFSSIVPSSGELWVRKDKPPLIYEIHCRVIFCKSAQKTKHHTIVQQKLISANKGCSIAMPTCVVVSVSSTAPAVQLWTPYRLQWVWFDL